MSSSSLYFTIFSVCRVGCLWPSASPLSSSLPQISHYHFVGGNQRLCTVLLSPKSPAFRSCSAQVKDAHIGLPPIKALGGKELGDSATCHLSCLWSKPLYHSLPFSERFELRPLSPLPPPNTFACSLRRKITWFQDCPESCFRPWA